VNDARRIRCMLLVPLMGCLSCDGATSLDDGAPTTSPTTEAAGSIDCDRVPHGWPADDEGPWDCPPPVDRLEDGSGSVIQGALAAPDAGTHLYGTGEYSRFGSFVAAANVDDDPADELIVTAWHIDAGSDLYVFVDPPPLGRMPQDTVSSVHIHEPSITKYDFNWWNSTVDVDGDGRAEYQASTGTPYIFSVPTEPGRYSFADIEPIMVIWASNGGLPYNISAAAHDATGDGILDLWMSCPEWDPIPEVDNRACLVEGPLVGDRNPDTSNEFAARYYEETNDIRGWDVLSRDFDGDGVMDVLVNGLGAPEYIAGLVGFNGLVSLITNPPLVEAAYEDVTTHTIEGSFNEALSYAVAFDPGDLDGDGYQDLFLSIGAAYVLPGRNGFVVFYGPLTEPATHSECADVRYTANEPFELTSDAVAAGDFNGDDLPDLTVGGYGEQWLFYSPLPSGNHDMDDADATIGAVGFNLGDSSAAGDIDGDGIDDLVLGAEQHTNVDDQDGSVFVYYGGRDL